MKKLIYCAAALATALFAGSCQQELLDTPAGENTVTYTVELPDVQTKAIGDGLNVDQLVYEVWKTGEEGELSTRLYQKTINLAPEAPRKWIVTLNLVQNQTYKALFWAQVGKPKGHENYNTDQLTNVYYAYDVTKDYSSNQESYAAFYGTDVLDTHTPLKGKTITLTRPFAQLNIGTLNTSLKDEYTIDMLQSSVEVTVPTQFNVATSQVANSQKITFNLADVPNDPAILPVSDTEYDYVAMNYVFAGENTTSSVEYTINTTITPYGATEGTPATINKTIPNVPLKENYRTNIVGNLLTSSAQYEVVIDKNFNTPDEIVEAWNGTEVNAPKQSTEDENIYVIEYPSELAWLAAAVNGTLPETKAAPAADSFAGKTFQLIDNVDLGNNEWTPIGNSTNPFKGIFDGNGKTVKNLKITGKNSNVGLFGMTTDGEIKNLTVENAKVSGRLNVGVVAGTPYTSKYTNITVKGHVEVNGMAYVGGVGGKNAYADWTDITVKVDETSYVNANSIENGTAYRSYVGGVVGFNGEGGHSFKNITSNIDVKGSTIDVGGLFGIAHYGNQFENCSCSGDVEIYAAEEADEAQEIGGIAGVWNNGGADVVMKNCEFTGTVTTNIDRETVWYSNLVGRPYSATGTGRLIIDGNVVVASANTLQAAINGAKDGDTITLVADINSEDGIIITDKNITIDLNDKTFTVSEGASTSNRNFKINGSSVVTIMNGTMVAKGDIKSGAYGTVRTEDSAKVTLNDVKAYSYRGYGLNVKACTGTKITIENSEIFSQYSGGVEAAGGEIELNNVHIVQNGVDSQGAWCSVAIGVNGGGKVTINSGEYSAAAIASDANAAQGTWVAYVMSSGGKLEINGGTFNGTVAETAAAANACGIICADRAAVVNINGGTFNSNGAILDMRNNVGTQPNPVATLAGGQFSADPRISGLYSSNLIKLADGCTAVEDNGVWTVSFSAVAKIGSQYYFSLNEAVNAVKEGETVTILSGTIEEGTIKLPATLKNVTFAGEEGATLKDMTISAADGNSYNYEGLTFDGITFDNSRILLTGWRNGDETINNLTVTNCVFQNLYDTTNSAPVHINKDAQEAVNGFTFTNNVINGATGGSKSGIYAQLTGNVIVSGNVINNVSFRPYVIQITTDDNVTDNFVVTNNTFSGSAVGRAQGLGSNANGTDAVNIVVTENIFKGISDSQQICYWDFNPETTTADLSHNYYDIDILANTGKIYFNSSATDLESLIEMGVYPIYTALNSDGTINESSLFSPIVSLGGEYYSTLEEAAAAAEADDVITLNGDVTLSSTLTLPAGVTLNGNGKQINGTIYAGGDLTFAGHTKVTVFSATYYNRTITIGKGACLEVTGTGRVTFAYGNTFNITGSIEDAKTADKTTIQPSLIIPGGVSLTGSNDFTLNIKDAYVTLGNTSSKPGEAGGKYTLNIENSIADFSNQLTFSEPTNGMNPTFNLKVKKSVLTTVQKISFDAPNSNVEVENSIITTPSNFRNSGTFTLKDNSEFTGNTIQFGSGNAGNDGSIIVDHSKLNISATSEGLAFDGIGKGSITLQNEAEATVTYYKDMLINVDATSKFTGTKVQ